MSTPDRRRWFHPAPRVFDALVAGALFIALAASFGGKVLPGLRAPDVVAWVLAVGLTAPYAVHRRLPWVALGVALASTLIWSLLHYAPFPAVSVFVLLFGITLHGSPADGTDRGRFATRRVSFVAFAATAATLVVSLAAQPAGVVGSSDWVSTLLATAVAWLAGDNVRHRRLRWTALAERARLLERERDDRERAAVAAERLRIARELHDVVAHSMSVIAVQAGVGGHVIDTDASSAKAALGVIESTSRDALVEMRRMLGVLREEDEVADVGPAPGLADINRLVAETRRTGLAVTLSVTGQETRVPAGVDLAAYRVVQEALTNVIKHGGPVAHVTVREGDGLVEIEITDEGRVQSLSPPTGSGHGLVGMRERVALCGGSFTAGRRPGGGWRVHASLPYAGWSA